MKKVTEEEKIAIVKAWEGGLRPKLISAISGISIPAIKKIISHYYTNGEIPEFPIFYDWRWRNESPVYCIDCEVRLPNGATYFYCDFCKETLPKWRMSANIEKRRIRRRRMRLS